MGYGLMVVVVNVVMMMMMVRNNISLSKTPPIQNRLGTLKSYTISHCLNYSLSCLFSSVSVVIGFLVLLGTE